MDVITGKTRPDTGDVFLGQTIDLLDRSEAEIAELGIGRKFQKPTVFEAQSVIANLELAMKYSKLIMPTLFARLTGEQLDRIDEVLKTIGLKEQRMMLAGALSHGQKQWLEIGMLPYFRSTFVASRRTCGRYDGARDRRTAELLTSLAGERTVVVVEHDMEFIRSIARTVTVLHQAQC